jgi:hypothetical protein
MGGPQPGFLPLAVIRLLVDKVRGATAARQSCTGSPLTWWSA